MSQHDPKFFNRVDAYLALANQDAGSERGSLVAASLSFATARFNTWLLANMYGSAEQMKARRDDAIRQLTEHYRQQLEQNYDDFVANYGTFIPAGVKTGPVL